VAAGGRGQPLRKPAPLRDAAEGIVEQHDRRVGAPRRLPAGREQGACGRIDPEVAGRDRWHRATIAATAGKGTPGFVDEYPMTASGKEQNNLMCEEMARRLEAGA